MVTEPSSPMTAQPPGLDRCERGARVFINESAPAIARASARIDAGPEIVFRILSDVANWPSWQPGVSSVEIDGPVSLVATAASSTGSKPGGNTSLTSGGRSLSFGAARSGR